MRLSPRASTCSRILHNPPSIQRVSRKYPDRLFSAQSDATVLTSVPPINPTASSRGRHTVVQLAPQGTFFTYTLCIPSVTGQRWWPPSTADACPPYRGCLENGNNIRSDEHFASRGTSLIPNILLGVVKTAARLRQAVDRSPDSHLPPLGHSFVWSSSDVCPIDDGRYIRIQMDSHDFG